MALRDEWKQTGKDLGGAFKGLGKNIGRSAHDVVEKADDAISDENDKVVDDSNVFNDGSWRKTGKDLGGAFKGLGKSIIRSAKTGLEKLDDEDN